MSAVYSEEALNRLKGIHHLSLALNCKAEESHQEKLLELARKHIDEIEMLYTQKDPHALVETGDLLILCLELLLEHKADCNDITLKCFDRYEKKLAQLLEKN